MKKFLFIAFAFLLFSVACSSSHKTMKTDKSQTNTDGWTTLFDGRTLNGWHSYQNKQTQNWSAKDGVLHCAGSGDNTTATHADLVTNDTFQNFELSIDWKISPQGNSGILYMVQETMPSSYQTGPEYQVIDDTGYPEKLEDWQHTGANYAMNPAPTAKYKPAGEWNHTRIIVNNGHVEHWLNGNKIVEYELWSDDWKARKAAGKWKDTPEYGMNKTGHIALQDHGSEAWFKNIKIHRL
jgi:Domain of Unknown Function (DUF1080)